MKKLIITTLLASVAFSGTAQAETENCTEITALPFTITSQGIYCLKKNLNVNLTTGSAITINAGNVTIDFNGWRVNNQAAATNQADGVTAVDRLNITLRNGFIRGFYFGVNLRRSTSSGPGGHLVEDMKIADSPNLGINVHGDKSVVRNNRVLNGGGGGNNTVFGIALAYANDAVISGNVISGTSGTLFNFGIDVLSSSRTHVTGNTLTGINGSVLNDVGIRVDSSDGVTVAGNRLLNDPGSATTGILDGGSATNLACLDNDIGGYVTALTGCDDDNGNRVLFN